MRVEHGDADVGALAGAAARDQRLQDRLVGVHAGADVDDGDAHARRRLGAAGDGGEPRLGLHQQVVGLAVAEGAVVAVARDRAADEAGMALAQRLGGVAELGERAGLEVLQQHVGLGDDRLEQALVLGLAEVGDDELLAPVEPGEVRALAVHEAVVVAGEVALGALELDDAGARVRQPAAGHGRGDGLIEREDERAGERFGHAGFRPNVVVRIPSPHSSSEWGEG